MSAHIVLDLDAIEAAAKAATPGPWDSNHFIVFSMEQGIIADLRIGKKDDAVHMATANPAVVIALIRRLRAAEGAARFFYAKQVAEGAVLDDETCGEFERQELAVSDIASRVVPSEVEFLGDEEEPSFLLGGRKPDSEVEEFALIWFEDSQEWTAMLSNGHVLEGSFGAVGYALHAALEATGRGEVEFDCVDDNGSFYRYERCDEFWVEASQTS